MAVISKEIGNWIDNIDETTYIEVLEYLKIHAESTCCHEREDAVGTLIWRTILAMTDIQYSVEELRDKDFEDKVVESCMMAYKWYEIYAKDWLVDYIVLYPDNRTFSVTFPY